MMRFATPALFLALLSISIAHGIEDEIGSADLLSTVHDTVSSYRPASTDEVSNLGGEYANGDAGDIMFESHPNDEDSLAAEADDIHARARRHLAAASRAMREGRRSRAAREHREARRLLEKSKAISSAISSLESRANEAADGAELALSEHRKKAKVFFHRGKPDGDRGESGREVYPDEKGDYHIDIEDNDIPSAVDRAVEPAARKIFRSFVRWFEKEYLTPRGNGGMTGGCFGLDCRSFGRPQGMHKKY